MAETRLAVASVVVLKSRVNAQTLLRLTTFLGKMFDLKKNIYPTKKCWSETWGAKLSNIVEPTNAVRQC